MQYRALIGLSYPPDRRAEAGDVVNDLPADAAKWLLAAGHIEPAEGKRPSARVEEGEV